LVASFPPSHVGGLRDGVLISNSILRTATKLLS